MNVAKDSEEMLNQKLKEFYELKRNHPYHYQEWVTSGELADRCRKILNDVALVIENILKELGYGNGITVKVARGASYYPKSPWIAILFSGEKVSNGVYPVVGFYGDVDGMFIGCVESVANDQNGFTERFCLADDVAKHGHNDGLMSRYGFDKNPHIANQVAFFPSDMQVEIESVIISLKQAIEVYKQYRHGAQSCSCGEIKSDDKRPGWYKTINVKDMHEWVKWIEVFNSCGNWIFRGQGDSRWGLESSLGVKVQYGCDQVAHGEELRAKEIQSLETFQREAKRNVEYQCFKGVELLALMQHYGAKTRLLDFTTVPLVALFWALQQYDTCIGAVNGFLKTHDGEMDDGVFDECKKISDEIKMSVWAINISDVLSTSYAGDVRNQIRQSADNSKRILESMAVRPSVGGVDIVMPSVNNMRISAQNGLFLMPRNLDSSFEDNMMCSLPPEKRSVKWVDCDEIDFSKFEVMQDWYKKFAVLKFNFDTAQMQKVREYLHLCGVSYKTIYPDLEGLAKSVTENITV